MVVCPHCQCALQVLRLTDASSRPAWRSGLLSIRMNAWNSNGPQNCGARRPFRNNTYDLESSEMSFLSCFIIPAGRHFENQTLGRSGNKFKLKVRISHSARSMDGQGLGKRKMDLHSCCLTAAGTSVVAQMPSFRRTINHRSAGIPS